MMTLLEVKVYLYNPVLEVDTFHGYQTVTVIKTFYSKPQFSVVLKEKSRNHHVSNASSSED